MAVPTTISEPIGWCAWFDGSGLIGTMTRQQCLDLEPWSYAYVWTTNRNELPSSTTTSGAAAGS